MAAATAVVVATGAAAAAAGIEDSRQERGATSSVACLICLTRKSASMARTVCTQRHFSPSRAIENRLYAAAG